MVKKMGLQNILRLKKKIGFKKSNHDVDKYFELIDLIYYTDICFQEDYNEKSEVTTWSFEDGISIALESWELFNLALFLLDLSKVRNSEMEKESFEEHFLEEMCWKSRKS